MNEQKYTWIGWTVNGDEYTLGSAATQDDAWDMAYDMSMELNEEIVGVRHN
jgi:hypothetical protein